MTARVLVGDCREALRTLPNGAFRCCVTSPPYFGLRDYGVAGQIGLEPTVDAYVAELVAVFREVRRVLADDGTLWLNLGDSYNSGSSGGLSGSTIQGGQSNQAQSNRHGRRLLRDVKPKDLIGIPWRVAFALQADGWYLRSDIIWSKPNPMPESVRDRPTKAHEYVFLLSKQPRYFYDADAVREANTPGTLARHSGPVEGRHRHAPTMGAHGDRPHGGSLDRNGNWTTGRNVRSVWTITPRPFKGAHFATFPPELVERCIKAGSAPGDAVLDPFGGAGTVGLVAARLGRDATLIELNPEYARMAGERIAAEARPLFAEAAD